MVTKNQVHLLFRNWRISRNEENYEKIYDLCLEFVKKCAFMFMKNDKLSEELTETIFVKIYNLDSDLLPKTDELSWLYSVIKLEATVKLKEKFEDIEDDEIFLDFENDNSIEKIINRDKFNAILLTLNEEEREIVTLKILGGFTFDEISIILKKNVKNIMFIYYKSFNSARATVISAFLTIITFIMYFVQKGNFSKTSTSSLSFFNGSSNSCLIATIIFFICMIASVIVFLNSPAIRKNK